MEMVITRVVLDDGSEGEWEEVMGDRMTAAESSPGWLAGCIARPDGGSEERLIVGLWESRDAWRRWHEDPAFRDSAERLTGLERDAGTPVWHELAHAGGRFA